MSDVSGRLGHTHGLASGARVRAQCVRTFRYHIVDSLIARVSTKGHWASVRKVVGHVRCHAGSVDGAAVADEWMAFLQQVVRHMHAHVTEADEADALSSCTQQRQAHGGELRKPHLK